MVPYNDREIHLRDELDKCLVEGIDHANLNLFPQTGVSAKRIKFAFKIL